MPKQPPIPESDFLRACNNHAELFRKLSNWNIPAPDLPEYASFICIAWMKLGEEHFAEADLAYRAGAARSTYSRAYYATYNASKGVRYLHKGVVSLKGDDHGRASLDLPDNFPDVARWSRVITTMLENRHHADYDNWVDTPAMYSMPADETLREARSFLDAAWLYLKTEYSLNR